MTVQQELLNDFKEILETVPSLNKVSLGRPDALAEESKFNAAYILLNAEAFESYKLSAKIDGYNIMAVIKVVVNFQFDDELEYLQLRSDIINAVLDDTKIWSNVVDRDVATVVYDEYEYTPKRSMEIIFEVLSRETC